MNYYLVAGEASGDLHGANLIRALKENDPQAAFRFFGGDLMQEAAGCAAVRHISGLSFMGFVEVIANLPTIFRNIAFAKRDILAFAPDALVLIDFPGFNLRIAGFAKAHGIRVFYYISPKIWAWNQKRVYKIRRVVDRMLCILPFEEDFYRKFDVAVTYVGNPVLDAIASHQPDQRFMQEIKPDGRRLVALLPGSRKQEISKLLPDMLGAVALLPGCSAVIAGAPNFDPSYYNRFTGGNTPVVFGRTYDLLLAADAAVVASGTAVLETALLKTPQVAVYKANAITVVLARMLLTVKFITLPNLIVGRQIVKELIQDACNPAQIAGELEQLLEKTVESARQCRDYDELALKMGENGASERAAMVIFGDLVNYQ